MIEELEKEYLLAVEREWFIRNSAFLLPTENICGLEVLPMTLRHYVSLRMIGSPFMVGFEPSPQDAFLFLWQVCPQYSPNDSKAKRRLWKRCKTFLYGTPPAVHLPFIMRPWRRRFERRFERFQILKEEIRKYVSESVMDIPPHGLSTGKSYFSDAAYICHRFANSYGWTASQTLDTPLKCLFQFYKILDAKADADNQKRPVMFNPSDKIQNRILAVLNQN